MGDSYCDCLGAECSKLAAMTRERDKALRQLAALQAKYNARCDELKNSLVIRAHRLKDGTRDYEYPYCNECGAKWPCETYKSARLAESGVEIGERREVGRG